MFFTQIQVQLIKKAWFAGTTKPKFESLFSQLWFNVLFHDRSILEFNHGLTDSLFIIVQQNFRTFHVVMVNPCYYFECTVSFIILSAASEVRVLDNFDETILKHGVLNPRISNKYFNCPISSYICLWPFCSLFQEKLSFHLCKLQKLRFHSVGCRGWIG